MKIKGIFTACVTAVLCGAIMFTAAFLYLSAKTDGPSASAADTEAQSVPYERQEESKGVMFLFPSGAGCLFFLDFEYNAITAIITSQADPLSEELAGYSVDYTVEATYPLLEGLIDRAGGVELEFDGEGLRYTGVQITELISAGYDQELLRSIISGVLSGFHENGFTSADLVYIIENSKTGLNVPDCFDWHEVLDEMCGNANVFYIV